ncbi:hypothetical protein GCM10023144_31560 [Pigmentiphaga soli]|uniref:Uncharacterized protein n=1 Tax=Pigmentiphaga soli TaxID=1007095 RepID=A0ABP8HBB2_9BURK
MGLFQDPRRKPNDTRASYARRRAPWLFVAAFGCTYYVLTRPTVSSMAYVGVAMVWAAAVSAAALADWSDLHK